WRYARTMRIVRDASIRRKRRSNARLRHDVGVVVIAGAPPRRVSGRSQRAAYQTLRRR
ncbi:MAG: hypothetical protein AVDCRST_MAG19-3251, partial [uncultured Thermomicrobiales bacterium]